jgi:hypothetical protein
MNKRFDWRAFWRAKQAAALSYAADFMPHPSAAQQPAVRRGRFLMNLGSLVAMASPLLSAAVVLALTSVSAMAQTPTGQFFGQDENSLGQMVNAAFLAFAGLLLLGGAAAIGWGITCIWTSQPYVKQFIGGILSFGFGAVIAAGWAISRGRTPTMPASLGQ